MPAFAVKDIDLSGIRRGNDNFIGAEAGQLRSHTTKITGPVLNVNGALGPHANINRCIELCSGRRAAVTARALGAVPRYSSDNAVCPHTANTVI